MRGRSSERTDEVAAVHRDYPLLMGILVISAAFIIICNLLADLAYAYLDPRVRYD